jgi:hypothetical protein
MLILDFPLHNLTVQEFVNIDKDLQTVQDISDVNIIILIYLCIKHVLFILMYLYKCKMHVRRVESFSYHMMRVCVCYWTLYTICKI